MSEMEIEIDDDVAEMIRHWAQKEGRTFEEQASVMIREALEKEVSKATSDDPKCTTEEGPIEPGRPASTPRG